jgi:hypothetical protein
MHLDGKFVTNDDLAGVISKMPFTSFEQEALTSHRLLIEQYMDNTSHVHNSKVLVQARAALKRIRDYDGDKKIVSVQSKALLTQLQL